MMKITRTMLETKLYEILQGNSPVRQGGGAVGKRGTNMYSPYPGNLKNNGIIQTNTGVRLDLNKVGYICYANLYSKKPGYIEKSRDEFLQWLVALGGKIR